MITESMIYWITRLDAISCALVILSIVFCAILIVNSLWYFLVQFDSCDQSSDYLKKLKAWTLKCIAPLFAIFFLGSIFCPTTKEMCAIKVIPVIANNEQLQKLGSHATVVTDKALKYIEDTLNVNIENKNN